MFVSCRCYGWDVSTKTRSNGKCLGLLRSDDAATMFSDICRRLNDTFDNRRYSAYGCHQALPYSEVFYYTDYVGGFSRGLNRRVKTNVVHATIRMAMIMGGHPSGMRTSHIGT